MLLQDRTRLTIPKKIKSSSEKQVGQGCLQLLISLDTSLASEITPHGNQRM